MRTLQEPIRYVALAIWLLMHSSPAAAAAYALVVLWTLAGMKNRPPAGLNDSAAAATCSNPTAAIVTLLNLGSTINVNTHAPDVSVAGAIGDSGQVAGYNCFHSSQTLIPEQHSTRWPSWVSAIVATAASINRSTRAKFLVCGLQT